MFTGIIEEVGVVSRVERQRSGIRSVTILCGTCLEGLVVGGSVAVNGACLTVTAFDSKGFLADISHETLRLSNLGEIRPGNRVNLERAARFNTRIDGHIVSGHIDGTGRLKRKREHAGTVSYEVCLSQDLIRYCIRKGSITLDGISLTINELTGTDISILTIPHTIKATVLSDRKPGDMINIEVDIIAKYVEKLLTHHRHPYS